MQKNDVHSSLQAQSPRIVKALLKWYRRSRRDLPWRAKPGCDANPYHVMVSEAMLQQTQVATVIPYFHRFLEAFPTLGKLAATDEQQVLHLWQGLGYYRRARLLHAAAKAVVADHAGQLPASLEQLRKLPGVGDYTAAALASIAFDLPHAVVDGNVARVLARVFCFEQAIDSTAGKRAIQGLADALMDEVAAQGESPGDWNQAVMELGAMVCSPKSPSCLVCPLRETCQGHRQRQVEALPVKLPKKKPVAVTHQVVVVQRRGKFLVEQRPDDGLWAGMWQLVTFEQAGKLRMNPQAMTERVHEHTGLHIAGIRKLQQFKHQTTHRTIQFAVYQTVSCSGRKRAGLTWTSLEAMRDLPMSNPQRRIVEALQKA